MKNLNKILATLAAAGMFASATPAVHAATTTSDVTVSVTLNTSCSVSTAPATVAFTYTANQGGAQPATGGGFGVTCTNGVNYSMSLTGTSGASGTLLGLNYTLGLSAAGGTGTGSEQNYSVTGSMAGGQNGTCTVDQCTTSSAAGAHVLTITY